MNPKYDYTYTPDYKNLLIDLIRAGEKAVIILRGFRGVGKTTWWKNVLVPPDGESPNRDRVCSANWYFFSEPYGEGTFKLEGQHYDKAHDACIRRYQELLEDKSWVIVDNNNQSIIHIAPYFYLARAKERKVYFVEFNFVLPVGTPTEQNPYKDHKMDLRYPRDWDFQRLTINVTRTEKTQGEKLSELT